MRLFGSVEVWQVLLLCCLHPGGHERYDLVLRGNHDLDETRPLVVDRLGKRRFDFIFRGDARRFETEPLGHLDIIHLTKVGGPRLVYIVEQDRLDQRRGPSSRLGTQAKLLYAAQVSTHPPTLALVVNDPRLFHGGYERYLLNRLREELPFSEVPIRLLFRKRHRMNLQDLKEGKGRRERRSTEPEQPAERVASDRGDEGTT